MSATERYGYDLTGDLARAAQELDAAFAGAWAPNLKTMVKATRTYGYFGGPELQLDGTITWLLNGTIVCPDGVLSLVQREPITGTVIAADPPVLLNGYRPMAVVRCAGGLLTRFVDARDAVLGKGARLLDDLEDVSLYDVQEGDHLVYDATLGLWINAPDAVGGGSADVQDEGTPIVTDAATINFKGAGVTVTDVGGVATVTVPGDSSPGSVGFPDAPPASPSAYDEEGIEASLNAKWTEVTTPNASYVRDTDRDGTFIGMSGPGNASATWDLREAVANADGDYPTALLATAKLAVTGHAGVPVIFLSLSDNAALSTGNYLSFGLVGGVGLASKVQVNNNGSVTDYTLPVGQREIYVHYQRNTAATNNVMVFVSFEGRAMVRLATFTKTSNVDYLRLAMIGGSANEPTALWCDWLRVNDPRFLQPE